MKGMIHLKSSLIIDSVDQNGVKKQKTITNINPEASNVAAKEFAQRFTALSTNEYTGASRVNKMDIDEPYMWGGGSTVTIAGDTVTVTVAGETITVPGEPVTVTVEAEPVTVQADPKTIPAFNLGEWSASGNNYSAVISYGGDGTLTTNTGTISGSTITVEDADGSFAGTISASEGTNYAPAKLPFKYTTNTVGVPATVKIAPTLALSEWNHNGTTHTATITYDGDGTLTAIGGTLSGDTLTVTGSELFAVGVRASETDTFAPAITGFYHYSESKTTPTLTVSNWSVNGNTFTGQITYSGDGTLSALGGAIVNNNSVVITTDSAFAGVVVASETSTCNPVIYDFSYMGDLEILPKLSLGEWTKDGTNYTAPITYGGDGTLSATGGTIANGTLTVTDDDGTFSGAVIASEGNNFAPTKLVFSRSVETVGGGGKKIPTLTIGEWELL